MDEALFKRWLVLHDRYGQGMDKPWRRITNADDRRENAEVVRMITEAAEQEHAKAQCHLGTMYLYGQGVPQSVALGVEWLRKAADQGYAHAQCNLGVAYANGMGVPQNLTEALRWLRKAHAQGNEQAAGSIEKVLRAQRQQ